MIDPSAENQSSHISAASAALEDLRVRLRKAPGDGQLWLTYARRLVQHNNARAAYEAIKNAADLEPLSVEAVTLLGEIESVIQPPFTEFEHRATQLLIRIPPNGPRLQAAADLCRVVSTQTLRQVRERAADKEVVRLLDYMLQIRERGEAAVPTVPRIAARRRRWRLLKPWLLAHIITGSYASVGDYIPPPAVDEQLLRSIRRALHFPPAKGHEDGLLRLGRFFLQRRPEDRWVQARCEALAKARRNQEIIEERKVLGLNGLPFSPEVARIVRKERRAIYALHESLPATRNGYTLRTARLIEGLRSLDWRTTAVTRPGYGANLPTVTGGGIANPEYVRLVGSEQDTVLGYINDYAKSLTKLAEAVRPRVIHGASNFRNGFAAVEAARRVGVPSVYEMRGLWHLSRAARAPEWEFSEEYRFAEQMELQIAGAATRVVTLSPQLSDWLIFNGVSRHKIDVVHNGVDTQVFQPMPPNLPLKEKLGLSSTATVFGYAGAVASYEGLGDLLEALRRLTAWGVDAVVLIVGGGPSELTLTLQKHANSLGVAERVLFLESVHPENVVEYYSVCTAAVVPRRNHPLTQTVPPMKVLEPMAMGLPLIASRLRPIMDTVGGATNVRPFEPGDANDLAIAMREIAEDGALRSRIGAAGIDWVRRERTWRKSAEALVRVYEKALQDTAG